MGLWPQFRSPLVWDVFAVSTYFTVSLLSGISADSRIWRPSATKRGTGAASHLWNHGDGVARIRIALATLSKAYLFLAGLATPLVISVHTVVSFDFTIAIVPGWHSTIFPPYFVAGDLFRICHGADAGDSACAVL